MNKNKEIPFPPVSKLTTFSQVPCLEEASLLVYISNFPFQSCQVSSMFKEAWEKNESQTTEYDFLKSCFPRGTLCQPWFPFWYINVRICTALRKFLPMLITLKSYILLNIPCQNVSSFLEKYSMLLITIILKISLSSFLSVLPLLNTCCLKVPFPRVSAYVQARHLYPLSLFSVFNLY